MDATIVTFLAILKAALRNEQAEMDRQIPPEEWRELFHLAGIHHVLPLFCEAVHAAPSLQQEQSLLLAARRQVRQQVSMQALRTAEFLELQQKLQAEGVQPLVVKGIVCRSLYPQPDHRPSSDEDVLIPQAQFALCHRILTDFGMEATQPAQALVNAYEVPYRKEGSPLYIELHKNLFPPESDAYGDMNDFFGDVFDRAIEATVQGGSVRTLAHTDHLLYLICHAFKHFLHSGFGIRQVCDIALYANAYGSLVDWQRILESCEAIRADKFAAALFQIGRNYLVFDPDRAAYPDAWRNIDVDEVPMLEDLLLGGLYGDASLSRKHSSNITLDAVAARKQGRKAKGAFRTSVFPAAAKLEGRYPYLKKAPYLLPVAWCARLWGYAWETGKSQDNTAAAALKIGSERVELMKQYGILEK